MTSDSRAVLTRSARPPDFTVRYGDDVDHVCDVWVPPGAPALRRRDGSPGPVLILFLHGGFWRQEYDRGHVAPLAEALAAAGYLVGTVEYRRTVPGLRLGWPDTFTDVRAALSTVPARVAGRLNVDLSGVILSGHSAGGHLALWGASVAGMATDRDVLAGVVALAPVADLRAAHQLDLDEGATAALLGGGPRDVPDRYEQADPLALLVAGAGPRCSTLLVHGTADQQVPVELSRRYVASAEAARPTSARVVLQVLPDIDHFAVIDPLSPVWPRILEAFADVSAGV